MLRLHLCLLLSCALAGTARAETLNLRISTDAPCIVLLDEQPMGQAAPGSPLTLETSAGMRTIGCLSLEYPAAMATATRGGSGTQSIAFTPAATWARFRGDGSGWLHDSASGLRWHQQASSEELGWIAAAAWCDSLGGRLPSRAELRALHVHGLDRTHCGEGLYCGVPHQLVLPSRFVWTSEEFDGDLAFISGLAGQKPSTQAIAKDQTGVRALCVAAAAQP